MSTAGRLRACGQKHTRRSWWVWGWCVLLVGGMILDVHALTLAWDAPVSDQAPASFTVYRNTNSGAFTVLGSVPAPALTYVDTTPPTAGKYCYQVTALYGAGVGESAPATIQGGSSTQLCFPAQPPGQLKKQ